MPEDLSIDLKDLIVSLLEKDPKKRIRMNELRVCTSQSIVAAEGVCNTDSPFALARRNTHGLPAKVETLSLPQR